MQERSCTGQSWEGPFIQPFQGFRYSHYLTVLMGRCLHVQTGTCKHTRMHIHLHAHVQWYSDKSRLHPLQTRMVRMICCEAADLPLLFTYPWYSFSSCRTFCTISLRQTGHWDWVRAWAGMNQWNWVSEFQMNTTLSVMSTPSSDVAHTQWWDVTKYTQVHSTTFFSATLKIALNYILNVSIQNSKVFHDT